MLTEQTWQAWGFPIYGAALHRVVYQDAVEYEEAGWLSQYSIKPWNFEIELTFYLLGLSNFYIHSLVHKHQGLSNYYTKTGKEIRKPGLKDSLLPNVLAIAGNNHIHICLNLQENSWECPDPSPEIHYKTLCLAQSK